MSRRTLMCLLLPREGLIKIRDCYSLSLLSLGLAPIKLDHIRGETMMPDYGGLFMRVATQSAKQRQWRRCPLMNRFQTFSILFTYS